MIDFLDVRLNCSDFPLDGVKKTVAFFAWLIHVVVHTCGSYTWFFHVVAHTRGFFTWLIHVVVHTRVFLKLQTFFPRWRLFLPKNQFHVFFSSQRNPLKIRKALSLNSMSGESWTLKNESYYSFPS